MSSVIKSALHNGLPLAAVIAIIGVAHAAEPTKSSGVCYPGSDASPPNPSESFEDKALRYIQAKCRPGDILMMPSGNSETVARVCDFTQTIVKNPDILCVLIGTRQMRR